MPPEEEKVFIKDPNPNMTIEQKNKHLSAELAIAPNVRRKIARIRRVEKGISGWRIYYRPGPP